MYRLTILLFLTFFINSCLGQVIKYTECTDADPKDYCKINEVRIVPCKEAGSNKPCTLKKTRQYKIEMDFTALKRIENLKALPYWASTSDLPFAGMNQNACEFTNCPLTENTNEIYDFQLKISKTLPRGTFDVKWKFWVDDNPSHGCCARFYLKLS